MEFRKERKKKKKTDENSQMNDDLVPVLHVYVRMYADKPHIHTRYTHMYNEFNRIIKKYQRKCLYTHTHTPCVYLCPCVGDRGV